MTTVSYTSDVNFSAGYVKVEWDNLGPNDDGQPFECAGLALASIHYWGDFNGNSGLLSVMASNEVSPTPANFSQFQFSNSPRFQSLEDGRYLEYAGAVLPLADANVTDVSIAMIFVPRT